MRKVNKQARTSMMRCSDYVARYLVFSFRSSAMQLPRLRAALKLQSGQIHTQFYKLFPFHFFQPIRCFSDVDLLASFAILVSATMPIALMSTANDVEIRLCVGIIAEDDTVRPASQDIAQHLYHRKRCDSDCSIRRQSFKKKLMFITSLLESIES